VAAISDDDAHPAGGGVSQTAPADNTHVLNGIQSLHERLDELQHVVAQRLESAGMPATSLLHARIEGGHRPQLPAWRRHTEGEARWQVALCTAVAIALQVAVPDRLMLVSPSWVLPALEGAMLVCLIIANPHRINRQSRTLRWFSLTLAALISFANAWSLVQLAAGLTNGIVFGLWYWEFDRGGPVARALGTDPYPDFQFPQMTSPEMAPPHWEPQFADYLYVAFTNAAAFSPTDTMPLSRWAKLAMTLQSAISIVTVALVVARAVNILQ
jgi:hypothetical protein